MAIKFGASNFQNMGSFGAPSSGGDNSGAQQQEELRAPSVSFDDLGSEEQKVYMDEFYNVYDEEKDNKLEATFAAEDKLFSWQASKREPVAALDAPLGIGTVPGDRLTSTTEGQAQINRDTTPSIIFDNLNGEDQKVYMDAYYSVYDQQKDNKPEATFAAENAIRAKYVNLTDNLLDDDTLDTLMGWEPGTAGNLTEDTKAAMRLVWQEYGKNGLDRYMNGGTVEDRKYAPQNSRWREAEQMIGPAHGQQVRAEAGISDDWQTLGVPQKADRYMSPENALDQMYTLLDPEYEESGVAPTWDTLQDKLESIDDPALRDEVSIAYNNMRWAMDQGGTASREDLEQAYTALDNLQQYNAEESVSGADIPQKADRMQGMTPDDALERMYETLGGLSEDWHEVHQIEDEDLRTAVGSAIVALQNGQKYGMDQEQLESAYSTLHMLEDYEARRGQVITDYEQNEERISEEAANVFADDGFARAAARIGFTEDDYKSLTDEARAEAQEIYRKDGNLDDWYIYDEETGEIREDMLRSTERPQVTWDRMVQEEAQARRDEANRSVKDVVNNAVETARRLPSAFLEDQMGKQFAMAKYMATGKKYDPIYGPNAQWLQQQDWHPVYGTAGMMSEAVIEGLVGAGQKALNFLGGAYEMIGLNGVYDLSGTRQTASDWMQRLQNGLRMNGDSYKEEIRPQIEGLVESMGVSHEDAAAFTETLLTDVLQSGSVNFGNMLPSTIAMLLSGGLTAAADLAGKKGVPLMMQKIVNTVKSPGFFQIFVNEAGSQMQETYAKYGDKATWWDLFADVTGGFFNSIVEIYETKLFGAGLQSLVTRGGAVSLKEFGASIIQETYEENFQHLIEYGADDLGDLLSGRPLSHALDTTTKDSLFNVAAYLDITRQTALSTIGMNGIQGGINMLTNHYSDAVWATMDGTATEEQRQAAAEVATVVAAETMSEAQDKGAQIKMPESAQHAAFESGLNEGTAQKQSAPSPNRETPREAEARQAETAAETIVQPAAPQAPTPEQTYRETARTAEEQQEAEAAQAALARLQAESEEAAPERQTPTPEETGRETARDQEAAQLRQEEARKAEQEAQTEQTRQERQIPTPDQTGRGTIREQLDQMQREREAQRQTQPVITRQAPTPDMTGRPTTRQQLEEQLQAERQIAEARAEALRRAGTPEETVQQMLDQNEQAQEAQRRTFEAQQELERRQQAIDRAGTDPKAQREEQRRQAEEEKKQRKEEKQRKKEERRKEKAKPAREEREQQRKDDEQRRKENYELHAEADALKGKHGKRNSRAAEYWKGVNDAIDTADDMSGKTDTELLVAQRYLSDYQQKYSHGKNDQAIKDRYEELGKEIFRRQVESQNPFATEEESAALAQAENIIAGRPDRQSPSTFQKETARAREEQQRQEEEARQSALDRLKNESQETEEGKLDQEISPEVPAETEREDGNRRAEEEITPEVPQETNANERADEEITSEVPQETNANERAAEEVASEVPEETSTNERAAEEVAPEPPAETPQDQRANEEIASEPPAETPADQRANEEIVSEPPAETPQDQKANEEIVSEPPAETPADQRANEEIVSEPPAETPADQKASEEIASEPPAETANTENAKLEQDLAAEAPKSEQKVNNPFRELQENGRKVARQMGFAQYSQGSRDTGVQISSWSGSMSADQQAELRIVDDLTRSLGITAVVDSTAAQAGAEGFYNKSEKEGTVLHLMQDGKNPLRVTLGHEAYHMLENLNPQAAATVRSIFEKYAAKSGTSIDNLINEKMETYRKMGIQIKGTDAQIREYFRAEVVADSLYDVIGDTASVRALAVRDRGLVERIRDWVGQMMNRLRKMTDRYASNSREARILRDNIGAMEEARNALILGLKDTEALQNAKKAALSLGQNSKSLSDFRDTMMNAQDDHEMNRGTRTLAGEILKQAGLENTTENIGKLVNAALDKESSGVTISEAMQEQGLSWKSSEENNRAFMTLARYMSALEDGGDISSIMEVMEGLDQDAEGQEDIRYSISPDNNADITEGIGTPADNMNAPVDNNTVEGADLTEAEARTLEEREGEVEQLQKELAKSEDLVRDLAGQVLDAREEMRNLRQKEGVSREEINSLRRQLNNRRMESEARAMETSILEKKLAAAQKKLHDYQVQLTSEKKLWKAKIRGQVEQSAIHEKHMKELNKAKQTLIHMFEHPSAKKGYVPQAYQQEAANFVEAILNGQGAEVEEYGDRLSRFIREAQSKNGGVSPFGENTRRMLQETYDILKEAREDSKYDGMIHSLEEYKIGFIVNTAQAVVNDIKYENALRGREKNEDLARETLSWANTANRNPHKLSGIAGKSWSYLMKHMSGQTFFEVVGQHGDNAVTRVGEELSKGERRRKMIRMNSQKIFQPLTEGVNQKRFQEFTGKKAIWYDTGIRVMDKSGNLTDQTMKLTGDMRASLYMHWQAESNRKGMEIRQSEADKRNGLPQLYQLVMPDIELMKKGKEAEAYARGYRVVMNAGQIENILNEMTDYEKAWCAAWRKAEGEIWNPSLNETSLLANGYEIAKEPDYFTISRSGNYTAHEFETVVQDERISHMGTLKERVRSNIPMMLVGISRVTASQIDSVSKYSGMLIPIQNLTRIFNGVTAGYEDSVREATAKAFGMDAVKYIENIAQDLQGGRKTEDSFLDKLRGKYAGAVLTGNPAVIVKQAASYPAAAAVLGYKALGQNMQYFLAPGRISTDLIDRYTSAHYDRRSQNLKDLEGNAQRSGAGRFAHKMGNGIQGMDVLTTKVLWKACETWVKDNTNLKPGSEADIKAGTDAFYQAVGQKYDEVLEWTQPEYDPMQRNAIQRSGSQIVKAMTMFKTQSFQNANLLINGFTKYSDMKAALKANPSSETAQQNFKQAKTQLAQTVSSQVISAVVLGVLTAMGKAIYHKMRDYEDDKGDMTLESVGGQIMKDSLSSMAGMVAGGSELFDFISGLLEGKSPFDIEAAGISTINDLYQNTFSLLNSAQIIGDGDMSTAEKLKKLQPKLWNFVGSMAQLLGIPLNNARNLVDGIAANTKDFIEGKPGSYQESGLSFLGSAQGRETSNKAVAGYIGQAMMDGNQAEAVRLYNEQLRQGKSADSLNTAIATWQKENIPEIRQAAEAIEGGDLDRYNSLIQEMTGMGLSMANAVKYVESERKKMKADTKETAKQAYTPMTYDQITAGMTKEESKTSYTNGMMNSLLESGNIEDALQVRDAMIASGKTMSTIKSSLTSYWKPLIVQAYEDGDIAYVREMTEMLVKMGMNRDTVSGWTKGKSSSKSTTTYSFGKTTFGATGFKSTKNYYSSKSYKKRTKSTSNFGKSGTFGSGGSFGSGGFGK